MTNADHEKVPVRDPDPTRTGHRGEPGRICAGMSEAQAVIERMTDQLKASQSGASQPREVLRQMLTKGSNCYCRCAGYLLEQERQAKERDRQ